MSRPSFIDELLAEQLQLTAVERFAQRQSPQRDGETPIYRDLIPLEHPRPGEQYAFQVDLDLCTGCKACVSACHSLNGLDENETWRAVGLLHGGSADAAYQQTVTTACHHCVDPACLNGCPVLAYEKDERTGIVRHLDDQCIGCQYCVLKCPYDVPKYSSTRGIVRKCDMCHSRLAVGEAPACAQACPSSAISIQIVSKERISRRSSDSDARLLPGFFPSSYTQPATQYLSRKEIPENCLPANDVVSRREPAHWPLIWMLLLTQMAAGLFLIGSISRLLAGSTFSLVWFPLSVCGLACLVVGLTASIFHLGRPLGAWRALLGLRRSWMSREILAFLLFAIASMALIGTHWQNSWLTQTSTWMHVAFALGLLAVFCSAMIYVDTHRPAWGARKTFTRFFCATLLLGLAGSVAIFSWFGSARSDSALQPTIIVTALATLILRAALFGFEMRRPAFLRLATGLFLVATVFGVVALMNRGWLGAFLATLSLLVTFGSRVIERYEFFRGSSGEPHFDDRSSCSK